MSNRRHRLLRRRQHEISHPRRLMPFRASKGKQKSTLAWVTMWRWGRGQDLLYTAKEKVLHPLLVRLGLQDKAPHELTAVDLVRLGAL